MTDANHSDPELHDLLRRIAAEEAPAVLERARRHARARAERLIEEIFLAELLAAAGTTPEAATERVMNADAPPQEADVAEPETGQAWWTYCVMWDQDAVAVSSGLEGVEAGSTVEAICDGHLGALVSRVPLTEYGDARLREHLEDLEWVERTARRHESVLEAALEKATIVPLRLCTLYREPEGVRRLLHEDGDVFREALARVEGCVEWGVKLFADTRAPVSDPVADSAADRRGATYLLRRQQERALAEKAREVSARCVDVVHQRLIALSRVSTINPPQRPDVHKHELSMLLNGAYLVDRDRQSELEQAVADLDEEWGPLGFLIELTGPWPPYNFVSGAAGVIS